MDNMYIVFEIQADPQGDTGVLHNAFTDKAQAEARFHGILSVAATSAVPFHAAVMLSLSEGVIGYGKYDRRGE